MRAALAAFFSSARLASALATTSIGVGILAWSLDNVIGFGGVVGILLAQLGLCAASAWARRDSIETIGILPISLLAFLVWSIVSLAWSQYQWVTLGSLVYLGAFTALGLYVAAVRDTLQVIRSFGDVLRFVLVVSIVLEVFSGILIDAPIRFLGIDAHLATGGPISGVLGNRNELGLLAVIGCISFAIEWRMRSIERQLAIGSLALAVITLVLTRSPIAWGTALVAAGVLGTLYLIRRLAPERRRFWQFAVLAAAAVAAVTAWLLRSFIVGSLNADGDLNYRLRLWQELWAQLWLHPVEGWGWIGQWNTEVPPYLSFGLGTERESASAVNAYLDVWFQLGFIGLTIFVGMLGLAFVRSWLLAAHRRSVQFTWPAVVLAALLTASLAESGILIEFGWMTFVICCTLASQNLSWRNALRKPLEQEPL